MATQDETSTGFVDPLGVYNKEDSDEFDFEFYLSQISPMTSASKKLESINLNDDLEGSYDRILHNDHQKKRNSFYDTDEFDLFILVDNPEKHATSMESFITFRISTKTTRAEYECKDYKVRRRYNDFKWLRTKLETAHPALLIPPLPSKYGLKHFDRFNQDFIKIRMLALQKFIHRISEHPILSYSQYLHTFLTAKQWEFDSSLRDQSINNIGLVSKLTDHLPSWVGFSQSRESPEEITEELNRLSLMQEQLVSLEKTTQSIVKEEIDLLIELNDWGPVFTLWSNTEDDLAASLNSMAKAIEKSYMGLQDMIEACEQLLLSPLKEYILYIDSIKTVFKRIENLRSCYETSLNALANSTDDTEKEKLQQQCNVLADKMTCADADLKADLERWHHNRRKDFKKMLVSIADKRIRYYQKCLIGWEESKITISKSSSGQK